MIFVTKAYPKLMFYIPSRPEPFYFDRGVFDTSEYSGREQTELEQVLTKLSDNPGFTGVMVIEDSKSPHVCETCGKGFQSQAALYGHLGTHKTQAKIEEEALREGSTVPNTTNVGSSA